MAAPTFFGKGTFDFETSGTQLTPVAFPASIAANDVAVMVVGCGNASTTFTTPSSQGAWAVMGTGRESDAGMSTKQYWLRLAGTEGSETVDTSATFSSTNGGYAQIFVFRGCITTGTPFEGFGEAGTAAETTPDSTACTTTGVDRRVVCICQLDNDPDFASGFPPAGWADMGGSDFTTSGSDWRNRQMDRVEASATTVSAAVVGTLAASTRWRTITFALIPEPAGAATFAPPFDHPIRRQLPLLVR